MRAVFQRSCPRCEQLRPLLLSGICAGCARAEAPREPPKLTTCVRCGEHRRNTGHGLCNRCQLANPDRPLRYGASLGERLNVKPDWWERFTAFVAARNHPGGAVELLRQLGRLLDADPRCAPPQLLSRCAETDGFAGPLSRALAMFFTGHCVTGNTCAGSAHSHSATSPSTPSYESCAISPTTSPALED